MKELIFRKPDSNDYPYLKSIWEDPDTMEAVGGIFPITEEYFLKWLDSMTDTYKYKNCFYLIWTENVCIGEVSFHRYDRKTKTAELNIKIKSMHRRNGFGKKALDFILKVFFNEWDGDVMTDNIRDGNTAGLNALKAYGFLERKNSDNETVLFFTREQYLKASCQTQ